MREAAAVILNRGDVLWHLPEHRSAHALPDSQELWATLWNYRDRLLGVAHSHPGRGRPSPSQEDLSTFSAVERGLGRRLRWWITSADVLIELKWMGPEALLYRSEITVDAPEWLEALRAFSREEVP